MKFDNQNAAINLSVESHWLFMKRIREDKPWNRIKTLPNVEIKIEQSFMKEYINVINGYAFGMVLREAK